VAAAARAARDEAAHPKHFRPTPLVWNVVAARLTTPDPNDLPQHAEANLRLLESGIRAAKTRAFKHPQTINDEGSIDPSFSIDFGYGRKGKASVVVHPRSGNTVDVFIRLRRDLFSMGSASY
jgi:hypothetical protein